MKLATLSRLLFPGEVCVGKGSIERLSCLDPARVLLVTDVVLRRTGALDRVTAQLRDAKATKVVELTGGEPCIAGMQAARAEVSAFAPEWIVALGGGAVLDSAKFLWAQFEHPDLVLSGTMTPIGPLRQKSRFVAVPSTAGSGSEASQVAVLTGDDGTKIPYVSPDWIPDIAILDPALTLTLPQEITLATGFDALAHAVEAAVSRLGNALVRELAAIVVRMVMRHLPTALQQAGNLAAREGMLEAAFLAGLCQSATSTGLAHALAHATSKTSRVLHGAATGFYLLLAMRWNYTRNAAVYDQLAVSCGLADGSALIRVLTDLAARLGLPQTLAELLGRTPDTAERQELAAAAAKDVCLRTNPCRAGMKELTQLVVEIA